MMTTHKKLSAQILSMALSVAMVTTMLPATVFAAEGDVPLGASSVATIRSFDKLEDRFIPSTGKDAPDHIYALSVALNTPAEDLQLPTELTAMVERTAAAPVEDEPIVDSGKPSEPAKDTATNGTVSGNEPVASSSEAEKEVIPDESTPLAPEPEQDEETIVTNVERETIPVTWTSDKEYNSDENGKFVYTAELPEGYILANGVKLPQIYVAVGKQARAGSDTYTVGTGGNYLTLKAAFDDSRNVTNRTTLQLLSDITESGINRDAPIGIYIDLNGHTLKGDGTKPMFTGGFSAYIMNKGLTGGTLDINGQDLTVYDAPTRTGADCYMSTSSADASITIKNSGSGGTLSLPSFMINSGSYVILDQSVTLENPNYPGTKLGLNLNLTNSTLINNGTIKTESRGGIVGTVKNEATGKIYIGAGSVESIDNTTSGGKVYVTGGSIKTITDTGNTGKVYFGESGTTPAVQYTFTLNDGTSDLGDNIAVDSLTTTPAYTYGMDGVKTRDTGKLYIWLPSGLTAASATVPSTAVGTYANAAFSGNTAILTKSAAAFVPVTDITGVPTTATAGTALSLSGTVAPTTATNKAIVWSVKSAGATGATISGSSLNTTAAGTVTVTATITNGLTASSNYTKDFTITVNAAGGSSSSDDSGSSSTPPSGGSVNGVTTPGKSVIDSPVGNQGATNPLTEAVKNAVAKGIANPTVYTNFANYTALTVDGIKAINDAATAAAKGKNVQLRTKIQLDNKVGNMVVSRITVDPAALATVATANIGLDVWFNQKSDAQVTAVKSIFEKAFDNKIVAITFAQNTPLAVNMELALKPDLSGLNTKTLYFYSYDPAKNIYNRIWSPGYRVDKAGFTHMTAPFGGSIVITDKPLVLKK